MGIRISLNRLKKSNRSDFSSYSDLSSILSQESLEAHHNHKAKCKSIKDRWKILQNQTRKPKKEPTDEGSGDEEQGKKLI